MREGGRIVRCACVVATAVNADGYREILGLDTFTSEDEAAWRVFLAGLVERGLAGVQLVVSDDHRGLTNAIDALLPGAAWQRCRTHFMRNLLTRVPKSAQPFVATMVRTVFAQPSAAEVAAQLGRVTEQLAEGFPQVAVMLEDAAPDVTAFAAFPVEHWRQTWSNNPQERLNREIRRRTDVVGIFPNREAVIRLTGMVLAEQHEWAVGRRYMSTSGGPPIGDEDDRVPDGLSYARRPAPMPYRPRRERPHDASSTEPEACPEERTRSLGGPRRPVRPAHLNRDFAKTSELVWIARCKIRQKIERAAVVDDADRGTESHDAAGMAHVPTRSVHALTRELEGGRLLGRKF